MRRKAPRSREETMEVLQEEDNTCIIFMELAENKTS